MGENLMDEDTKREIRRIIQEELRGVIGQFDVLPDIVKQRHVGEGVRFVRAGLATNRPTSGEKAGAVYLATDTDVLSAWNGTAWVSETLT